MMSALRRVVIATETFHPEMGGGETQARTLANALLARGYAVTLVTRRSRAGLAAREHEGRLEIARVGPTGRGRWKKWGLTLTAFPALLRAARDADAVLVSGFRILGMPAMWATRIRRIPCVLKGDSRGEISGEFFRAGLARWRLTPRSFVVRPFLNLRNAWLRRAEGFVALSNEMAAEFFEEAIPPEHVHQIPNGVDVEHFRPASAVERAQLRRDLSLPDGFLAVYTGRLVTYKGLPELVRAWRALQQNGLTGTLLLVGEGGADIHACEEELREFVRESNLSSRVLFTGPVPDVARYLRAADCFVFPTMDEAFGLSLVEAMACGLPVVSTAVGGIRDFLVDGHNGIVIPPGDEDALCTAIRRVTAGGADIESLAHAARDTALSRFSQERVVDRLVQLFESLRTQRASGARS